MPQVLDAGVANHSVSAALMKLVNVHHEMDNVDFEEIVKFLEENLDNVITEVHKLDKLCLDDGEVREILLLLFVVVVVVVWKGVSACCIVILLQYVFVYFIGAFKC